MAMFKSSKAKEISESNKSKVRVISANGQKNIVNGVAKKADINIIPKYTQEKKTIKTYDSGKLVKKEKQGHDILGRPTTKQKTYVDGKINSVVKRVLGNNKEIKIVKENGKRQVSKGPATPSLSGKGFSAVQKNKFFSPDRKVGSTNCNTVFRKRAKERKG